VESKKRSADEIIQYAYKLKCVAEIMDMTNTLINMTPSLLEVVMEFNKLILSILPLMEEKNELFGNLLSMENKLKEIQSKCKKLKCDLEETSKKKKKVAVQHHGEI
jgi:hypothetical protein